MRRAILALLALLAVVQIAPVWLVRFHPLPDMPNHLAAISIWHHLHDPRFDFAQYYQLALGAAPYWAHYFLAHLLAYVVGVDVANRLVLSAYLIVLPIGFALLARRFGRSPWLALFAIPLAWSWSFAMGFISSCIGLALLPLALVAFDRFCERPTLGRGGLAAALGAALFFCHLIPWGLYLGCAGLIGLLREPRGVRVLGLRAAVWGAALAVGAAVVVGGRTLHMGEIATPSLSWVRSPFADNVRGVRYFLLGAWSDAGERTMLTLAVVWAALLVTARGGRTRLADLRAEACALVCVIGYFAMPRSIIKPAYWWGISFRFAAPACLFLALTVPGKLDGWRRLLLVPVAGISLAFLAQTTMDWQRVGRWLDGLDELARRPSVGERVLVLQFPPIHEPTMNPHLSPHRLGALRQAYYGGFFAENFDQGFPIAYKKRLPAPPWDHAEYFLWNVHAPHYHWLLAFQAPASFLADRPEAKLAGTAGNWKLWRLPRKVP